LGDPWVPPTNAILPKLRRDRKHKRPPAELGFPRRETKQESDCLQQEGGLLGRPWFPQLTQSSKAQALSEKQTAAGGAGLGPAGAEQPTALPRQEGGRNWGNPGFPQFGSERF